MEIKFTDRGKLKEYFKKNKIPREEDFRELIDASINQGEDGIVKLPKDPLSIEGVGEKDDVKRLLNFYNEFSDPQAAWSFNLNDRNSDGSVQKGFSIASQGSNRFFIQDGTGKVGIGITKPLGKLHIINKSEDASGSTLVLGDDSASNLRLGYHDEYAWIQSHGGKHLAINPLGNNVGIGITKPEKRLHVSDGEIRVQASHNEPTRTDIVAIYSKDGTQGIGFSGNRMDARGTNQDLEFVTRGSGLLRFYVNNGALGSATFQVENNLPRLGTSYAFSPHAHGYGSLGNANKAWGTVHCQDLYCHDFYLRGMRGGPLGISDIRLKENLVPIPDALGKLQNLTGYRYDFKKTFFPDDGRMNRLGLVAQEVEQVLPESVQYMAGEDTYFVDYTSIIPVLVEGMKQLAAQVNQLQEGKRNGL